MPLELLIHNFGYVCSGLLSISLGTFILFKDTKNKTYRLFFLTALSYFAYCIIYLLAVNIPDSDTASIYAFLMILVALTPCFNAHLAFSAFNIEQAHKKGIRIMYSCLALMYAFFLIDPSAVRLESAPKAYFPNFFVPGHCYWIYVFFFFGVIAYFFTVLIKHYKFASLDDKSRFKYFFIAFGWGYMCSLPVYMLILNVTGAEYLMVISPIMGLYTIPLAYGVFRYDLLNMKVAIKNALLYTIFIVFVGASIIVVNLLNNYLVNTYTNFPIWALPLFSGVLVFLVGAIAWNQLRQADLLKYEFINNISHKFRTPLTHVRWMVEEFRDMDDPVERNKLVNQIQFTNMRLFELTNAVISASQDTNDLILYHFTDVGIVALIDELKSMHKQVIESKGLDIQVAAEPNLPKIRADKNRLEFALQILFENAVVYTPDKGTVKVTTTYEKNGTVDGGEILVIFKDNGIGISDKDLPHVFSKFYRSQSARHTDTEGMGIGLFMAKNIVEKHNGRIWAESKGEGTGSTFSVALPVE